jgi:hypothetical protein
MGDSLQSLISAAPWAPLAVAFLVGLVCGWLIWGLRGASAESAEITPAAAAESGGDERKEIVVLRAEIEAARALLDQHDTPQDDITSQLLAVDEALKRANGRLKIIQRGLKR